MSTIRHVPSLERPRFTGVANLAIAKYRLDMLFREHLQPRIEERWEINSP